MKNKMWYLILGVACTVLVSGYLYMRYIAKNTPSIISNEYDEKMKADQLQDRNEEAKTQ